MGGLFFCVGQPASLHLRYRLSPESGQTPRGIQSSSKEFTCDSAQHGTVHYIIPVFASGPSCKCTSNSLARLLSHWLNHSCEASCKCTSKYLGNHSCHETGEAWFQPRASLLPFPSPLPPAPVRCPCGMHCALPMLAVPVPTRQV